MTTSSEPELQPDGFSPSRRDALNVAAGLIGLISLSASVAAEAAEPAAQDAPPASANASRLQIVMLAHPNMTALDLVGPQLIFATMPGTDVHIVWKDMAPVTTDSGLNLLPTATLATAPSLPDVLFVPGGLKGTTAVMKDDEILAFLRDRGARARYVTSVCTGGLLLGAAGLLQGHRATTHWYVRDTLAVFDAIPVDERVVVDRNRVTGAGVTAGIDMALTLSALLRGEDFARAQQLVFEYAPKPPFASGTPALAGDRLTSQVLQRRSAAIALAKQTASEVRKTWTSKNSKIT